MSELVAAGRRKSGPAREINAVMTIMARDITLFFKSPMTIIMSLAMPVVMLGMLGGSLSQNMSGGLGFNYNQFMLVGMIVNMLFMTTTMGISSLVEDRTTDFTQEMMISPVSRYSIIIGKILGSSFGAIIGMFGTIIVGLCMGITLNIRQLLLLILLSPLMCLSAGSLAIIIIGVIKNSKTANTAVSLITMPQMFLSGAIIPIGNSHGILYIISRMMPMTYCLDLARSVVYAGTDQYESVVLNNPALNLAVILVLTVVCLTVGTFFFARSEKNR
ncbi:ABC-2 type transporter [Ruminiclostridium hungatei]|uniref:Transport permease protein n=1 Tax=Ruminiclostridium hungatei TaxID=48256 RepID=A0A1V4SMU3_RUMHU|nr:ABC transporter permease [Ruminiclostridium hungatei]OPX45123.1 ABC-2 type transporter [Ruminiclostridium hungatei]